MSHSSVVSDVFRRHIQLPCRLRFICPRSGGSRKSSAAWVTDVIFADNEEMAPRPYLYHGLYTAPKWLPLPRSQQGQQIPLYPKQQSTMGLAENTAVSEARLDGSQESLEVKSKTSWKGYLWDTWTLPQEERRLLFKLDAFVLTFASVCALST